MKKLILLCLILPFMGISQLSDTTCISARWIALKPTSVNAEIFGLDTTKNEKQDLIHVINELVEVGKLSLYNQNDSPNGKLDWNWIDYQKEVLKAEKDTFNYTNWRPYFTLFGPQSDIPLSDRYGEPLIYENPEGFQEYIYPPRDVYYYPTREVDEIRIKEKRTEDPATGEVIFTPVGLSFYFKGSKYHRGHEVFWIDLTELSSGLKDTNLYPWYAPIFDKKYQGFQYMQVSCYDDEVKY